MAIFASVGREPPIATTSKKLNVKGNSSGISHGWFNFPWNYDPTWLENCDGWEQQVPLERHGRLRVDKDAVRKEE